jgi:succinyl-CoA synthetase alpha subunit
MIVRGHETVLVMGITGKQGTFWAEKMRDYGTHIVGGVNPKRAGEQHLGLPVWATAADAAKEAKIDCAVLFIPPFGAKQAALDAVDAGIGKIVCLTEHIPVHDTMYVLAAARERGCRVVGPNTAGLVTTGECFVGFMPAFNARVFKPGPVGVISRSGSLGTLVCLNLVQAGLGISALVGIGGDPIIGTTTKDALVALDQDPRTRAIALVGEIGGAMEEAAAEYARTMDKPVAAFIAGAAAPAGKKMGHAGAIVLGDKGSYAAKKAALEAAGVTVCATPNGIPAALAARLGACEEIHLLSSRPSDGEAGAPSRDPAQDSPKDQ